MIKLIGSRKHWNFIARPHKKIMFSRIFFIQFEDFFMIHTVILKGFNSQQFIMFNRTQISNEDKGLGQ